MKDGYVSIMGLGISFNEIRLDKDSRFILFVNYGEYKGVLDLTVGKLKYDFTTDSGTNFYTVVGV